MSLLLLAAVLAQQPAPPPVQRPSGTVTAPAPARPVAPAPVAPAPEAAPVAVAPVVTAPVPQDMSPAPAVARVEPAGPPFYSERDMEALRQRYGLEASPPASERRPVFRCWVADPTCGLVVELNATSAFAYRVRQGTADDPMSVRQWNSARVQYDLWVSIPTVTETRGKLRFTRLSLGPKGGVVASDNKEIWGNVGIAARYWFSRKRFAPALEFTSALVFKVAGVNTNGKFDNFRAPLGFTADIGFGLGGFGSIVVGGQFDSPFAREDIPAGERILASGMFFIGFRGNIVWGAPAALAVGTHAAVTRAVPPR